MEHEKKRILGLVLASVTALGLLSGCGGGGIAGLLSSVQAGDGGKILNIYVWNEEFQGKFNENCPQVERLSNDKSIAYLKDGTEVHWIVNPTQEASIRRSWMRRCSSRAGRPPTSGWTCFWWRPTTP